jgi:hypothetical protein
MREQAQRSVQGDAACRRGDTAARELLASPSELLASPRKLLASRVPRRGTIGGLAPLHSSIATPYATNLSKLSVHPVSLSAGG